MTAMWYVCLEAKHRRIVNNEWNECERSKSNKQQHQQQPANNEQMELVRNLWPFCCHQYERDGHRCNQNGTKKRNKGSFVHTTPPQSAESKKKKRNSSHPTNKPKLKTKFRVIMYDEFFAIQRTRTIHLLRTVKTISVCECRWQQQRTYSVFVLTK